MKIEKIRINGFKTFADETILNFHPGITCIVGPNGCGKSNVVDSFKWVIGEQSAKTLRSTAMGDVIFNGTSKRTQKGMAAVTIYLSEIGESTDGDNKKITVTRKLNRFGESEYLIDNQKKRLKDVRDLFLDTGLEVGTYSILEQGKISEVIIAKPQDRRYLIEEAAGVMKYKARKTEATAKLERAKINLDRITDIVNEVKRSIGSLERQVKKAENYKKLMTRLGEIELKAARHDFLDHQIFIGSSTIEKTKLIDKADALNLKYLHLEDQKKVINITISSKEKVIETKNETFHKIIQEIALIEKDSAIKETEINNITTNISRYALQKDEYIKEMSEDSENIKKLTENIETIEKEKLLLEGELEIFNNRLAAISEGQASKELLIKDKHRSLFKVTDHINQHKNEISRIQSAVNSLKQKHVSGVSFTEKSTAEIDEFDKKIASFEQSLKSAQEIIFVHKQEAISLKGGISLRQGNIDELRRSTSILRETLASNNARLSSLEDFTSGELNLDALSEHIDIPISEIIDAAPEYETAVESALAERIKGFVLKDRDSLKGAVKFVKDQAIARTVFISKEFSHDCEELSDLKALYKFVNVSDEYFNIIKSMLSDYYVISSIDAALDYQKNNTGHKTVKFVTMEGDIIEHSGAVITGRQSSLLKHFREIKSLKESIPKLNMRID
ncbi:MAG: AAA family ATPase, partial [Nitrospirae bacterium]|nr:AAA family ATPase [Nitrospirota bacterium]